MAVRAAPRVVQGPLPVSPRRLPAPGHRGDPRRQSVIVSAPTGAGKTLVAEFAIHARAQPRPPHRLHHAAEGALQPEVRRLRAASSAPSRSASSPATSRSTPRAPAGGDDHRDPAQHVLHRRARGPRDGGARRVPLHGRRGARDGVGGDHRQLPAGRRAGRAVRHRARTSTRSPTGSASCTGPSWPSPIRTARCRCSTWSPTCRARSTPTTPSATARCACSARSARAATTTAGAGTRAGSSIPP